MSRTLVNWDARSTCVFRQAETGVALTLKNNRGETRFVVVIRFSEALWMFARYIGQCCGGGSYPTPFIEQRVRPKVRAK
jgi:hypothetical protein